MEGFVKIHRAIKNWEWYPDLYVKALFLELILSANVEDKKWMGQVIKRGQLITSLAHLAAEAGMSVQQTRTALEKLVSTNEITKQATNKYTLITITNYECYQLSVADNQQAEQHTHQQAEQQTSNKRATNEQQQLKNISSYNLNNNLDNNNSLLPLLHTQESENWREVLIDGWIANEQWLQYKSQEVRIPVDVVRNALESFKYQLITSKDVSSGNETELVMHATNWLRKHKQIMEIEKSRQNGYTNKQSEQKQHDRRRGVDAGDVAIGDYAEGF